MVFLVPGRRLMVTSFLNSIIFLVSDRPAKNQKKLVLKLSFGWSCQEVCPVKSSSKMLQTEITNIVTASFWKNKKNKMEEKNISFKAYRPVPCFYFYGAFYIECSGRQALICHRGRPEQQFEPSIEMSQYVRRRPAQNVTLLYNSVWRMYIILCSESRWSKGRSFGWCTWR